MGRQWLLVLTPLLLSALAVESSLVGGLSAQAQQLIVELECQLHNGPWQRCHMVRAADGYHWRLEVDHQALLFRHDGHGAVSMRRGALPWHTVEARWRADSSLCWNGICARGPIPLD